MVRDRVRAEPTHPDRGIVLGWNQDFGCHRVARGTGRALDPLEERARRGVAQANRPRLISRPRAVTLTSLVNIAEPSEYGIAASA